ncbi:MAG: LysM peptidoglycan-binding domain-containing protein [Helicobacteraceae bacterium]|jgi:membrane-bound lytic murein transglycosylase D|nr:LysM peptidoglycan-binding domain-containing protein [Helicobacteraceae bacterium]
MKKVVFLLAVFLLSASAALYDHSETSRDRSILIELDVDESFLRDGEFRAMKNNFAILRREKFVRILSDAYIYQPMIKQKIADAGLPSALVYMAMAESSFKPKAFSKAKAAGIWQFMSATAKRYGLKVDNYVDERRDPLKSTDAAIRYLNDLYARFGKWSLAIMAYNCGEGRVEWAIAQAGTDDLSVLMSVRKGVKKQYLPTETRAYLRKVLAMASLAESESLMLSASAEHLLNRGSSYPLAVVEVAAGATLAEIAKATGVSTAAIKQLNPSLNYEFVPPYGEKYSINVPYEKVAQFKQNYVFQKNNNSYFVYYVQKGDSLSHIAGRYGVSVAMIKDFNKLKNSLIHPKDKLIIPVIQEQESSNEYIVQRGDSLGLIAKKFKTSVEWIRNANNLKQDTIFAGDRLIIRR